MSEGAIVERSWLTRTMWIVWPAFMVAGIAETIFFALFDPNDLHLYLAPRDVTREAIYTLGFIGFWAVGIASSSLTVLLGRPPHEVNRCPLLETERPTGCPKREETGSAGFSGS
jgi:hypothetical protein